MWFAGAIVVILGLLGWIVREVAAAFCRVFSKVFSSTPKNETDDAQRKEEKVAVHR
jgi:hypothetical protein